MYLAALHTLMRLIESVAHRLLRREIFMAVVLVFVGSFFAGRAEIALLINKIALVVLGVLIAVVRR
jgi:hypothetical protein